MKPLWKLDVFNGWLRILPLTPNSLMKVYITARLMIKENELWCFYWQKRQEYDMSLKYF